MGKQYRIVEWDIRYEVDDKGREWEPGKVKRKTPLAFVRLKVHGKDLGHGYRRMQKLAGKRRSLQVFGLFCKMLEIAADGERDQRNLLPDASELAEMIEAPVQQVEFAVSVLLACSWIQEIPDGSRKLPETPGSSPLTERTNRTEPTEPTNDWRSLREKVAVEFGRDRGIEKLLVWLGAKATSLSSDELRSLCSRLESLLIESRTKDNPAAWFQSVAGSKVGYRPQRRQR